ncbi:MAG: hypothetical protein ACI8PZ_005706 [Myxococcota bacterium]|jgi:hypothetical protein
MRWTLLLALSGCGIIEILDKDPGTDTATTGSGASYPYVLIGDRGSNDVSPTAGVDIEGVRLETASGSTYYATVVQECKFGSGREADADCGEVTGSPGSATVSLGGDGGSLIVSFGGELAYSGDVITVYEDGYEGGELYDIYLGDSSSSTIGSWVTCAAGATGETDCEVP